MTGRGTSYEGRPLPASSPAGTRRVALVIGNSAYPNAPLKNPRNDAEAFAAKLKTVHPAFDVTLAIDVGRDAMEDALENFEARLSNCDDALLFFAGHGLQVKGINYLMPVDADIRQEIHLKRRAVSLNEVLEIMGRRVRTSSVVFLDACRDNPFARSLLVGLPDEERGRFLTRSGLAEVRAGAGSFVAFATAPDNVALDGSGANSPFTTALVAHMGTANTSINDVMIAVRKDVLKSTGGRQEPWDQSSLRERFSFHNAPQPDVTATPSPIDALEPKFSESALFEKAALEHWETVKYSTDPARLRAFLADYGTSRVGALARDVMQNLATAAWRRVRRQDEAALLRFIADFTDTREVIDANAALASLGSAKLEGERLVGKKGTGIEAVAVIVGAAILAICIVFYGLIPWSRNIEPVQVVAEKPRVSIVSPPAPVVPAPAGCPGVGTETAAKGVVCLDLTDAAKRQFRDCKGNFCGPMMVMVPTGNFTRQAVIDYGPVTQSVSIRYRLAVGKFEVTFDEWDECLADGGCKHRPGDEGWGRGRRPVINISMNDITGEYLPWLNTKLGLTSPAAYRLLSEAEWEYAARSGTTTKTSFGDNITINQAQLSATRTAEVGSFPSNPFGINDMHGNVEEWVQDCYVEDYNHVPTDGSKAPETEKCARVLRSDSFGAHPGNANAGSRVRTGPDSSHNSLGFRLARTLNPEN